eukprot:TRINITY_DN32781_c0_g1_i2.p1 TRINITY_DN32781_c0_g1~~TRINITY_DN32781_c0_g1_i2.p1  ORF type:complete len:815 (-),score=163.23 TRINITY_DN32781_c0_g1_i2:87-2531(-)
MAAISSRSVAAAPFKTGIHAPHLCGPYRAPAASETRENRREDDRAPVQGDSGATADDEENKPLSVYCDLDGVLADFNKGCMDLFPEGGPIAEKIPNHTVTKLNYEEETEMWRRIESKSDFFAALDWTSDGELLWRWIDWNIVPTPAVLTGLPMGRVGQMASKQKEQWCQKKLGQHVQVFCCGTRNKQKFSGKRCVLIDDRGDLREAWEARGGIFVHHVSAADSIRQLREILHACGQLNWGSQVGGGAPRRTFHLMSVCWAAQTPAGCFRKGCRYMHVPISPRHRSWIQLWGFVMWNKRMFDELEGLANCVRAVYAPSYEAAFSPEEDEDMDVQSNGAFQRMFEILSDSCELGLPFGCLSQCRQRLRAQAETTSLLPPLPSQARSALQAIGNLVRSRPGLGPAVQPVVIGSMGLAVEVDGADLDLTLCCPLEMEPCGVLRELEDAVKKVPEISDVQLMDQAYTPVLIFRWGGMTLDVTVNQMGAIRDTLLLRYALRTSGTELAATLRLLKLWLRRRRIPGTKVGGFPTLVWIRQAVRFYQEYHSEGGARRVAMDWLRRFLNYLCKGLPTGGAPMTVHGEQAESGTDRLAKGVPTATVLLMVGEVRQLVDTPAITSALTGFGDWPQVSAHAHLCPIGSWGGKLAVVYTRFGDEDTAPSELILCRIRSIIGGPTSELRSCDCDDCLDLSRDCSDSSACALQYVSRRSRDWIVLATRCKPADLSSSSGPGSEVVTSSEAESSRRSSSASVLRRNGIQKRRRAEDDVAAASSSASTNGCSGLEGGAQPEDVLLLHPCHLVLCVVCRRCLSLLPSGHHRR